MTGVQTCALPIYLAADAAAPRLEHQVITQYHESMPVSAAVFEQHSSGYLKSELKDLYNRLKIYTPKRYKTL